MIHNHGRSRPGNTEFAWHVHLRNIQQSESRYLEHQQVVVAPDILICDLGSVCNEDLVLYGKTRNYWGLTVYV